MAASQYQATAVVAHETSLPKPSTGTTVAQPKASATSERASYLHIEGGHARVRNVSRRVFIPNNIYSKTNFYIKQSRKYFPGHPLHCLLYFRGMQWVYLAVACLSVLGPVSAIYAFLCFVVNAVFTAVFSQHLYVVFTTLPIVLSQPIVQDDGGLNNRHLEISVEHQRADILQTNGEIVGIVGGVRGKGKIQAFTVSGMMVMKKCRIVSIVCFVACCCFLVYCSASGILVAINGNA